MSTNWDVMRQYEDRMKELREAAEEEGIEVSEVAINTAIRLLHDLSPSGTDLSEEPSRLMKHKEEEDAADDEWQIPS